MGDVAAEPHAISRMGFVTDSTETHGFMFTFARQKIHARVQIYESSTYVSFSSVSETLPIKKVPQMAVFETLFAVEQSSGWES